jgi:ABC-type transport system substrate-binding protein
VNVAVPFPVSNLPLTQDAFRKEKFEGMAMVQEQRRTKELEARKQLIFDIQRYAAEQQYYVYLGSQMLTGSWQSYVKNYAPNPTFDYGSRVAALWLDRS